MKTIINDIMGGRRRLTLPAHFCRVLNLKKDDFITISLENGGVTIRPVKICDNCVDETDCPTVSDCAECENAVDCLIDTVMELEPAVLAEFFAELMIRAIEVVADVEC